jgi:outer membrane protein assembly factor BamA
MRGLVVVVLALWCSTAHADEPAEDDAPRPLPELPPHDDELGPVIQIEAIEIKGNSATQDEIIRRAMPIAVGDVLKASDARLSDARFKILALGFFRDVDLAMRKGSSRGYVIIDVTVVERGTLILNKLWFGRSNITPYWLGVDVGERNLLGLGIATGIGFIYGAASEIAGAREQWASEIRIADGSLRGTRWGAHGSLTLVHGSDTYRAAGDDDDDAIANFRGFGYRRFGGRFGVTYDVTPTARFSGMVRLESINAQLPSAPTRELVDGRTTLVDLRLQSGESRIATAGIGFDRDTRSDPILPHTGGRFTAALEVGTSALASNYDFATMLARYEHWWPLRDQRHTIGIKLAGGVVIGDAPRFDRIFIGDVNRMLTPRALGLILSNAAPIDFLSTRDEKPTFGELGGIAMVEYAAQIYRGINARKRVYGGDFFFATGLWGLAEATDVQLRDASVWRSLPIDLYIDMGVRIDTDYGIFEFAFANALGRLR